MSIISSIDAIQNNEITRVKIDLDEIEQDEEEMLLLQNSIWYKTIRNNNVEI